MTRLPFLAVGLILFLTGCTHSLHVSHISDFSPTYRSFESGSLVKSKVEQFVVLGFAFDVDYVTSAYEELQAACIGGDIQGVKSEYWTSHGFFSWTNSVEMEGLCVRR